MRQKWSLLALTAILTLGMVDASAASSIVFTKGGLRSSAGASCA